MIEANIAPDVILDGTRSGEGSDAIKSLARSLGIPIVALSHGTKDELRCVVITNQVTSSVLQNHFFTNRQNSTKRYWLIKKIEYSILGNILYYM